MIINIKEMGGKIPEYKTNGAAGADCFARLTESVTIEPGKRRLIPLGFGVEIPEGYEMQIRPRSGLAHKNGISIVNTPGTIDSDYRGEVHANLLNTNDEPFVVNNGDRVAQAVIAPVFRAEWNIVSELSDTERGTNGFGSTGK